ncbi:MAG: hypothetical protein F6J95_025545 [Leptolyngbya sp. SIO1E4]|nr:hypothetical protein [Leptolyngbya sp. SIO1E4]
MSAWPHRTAVMSLLGWLLFSSAATFPLIAVEPVEKEDEVRPQPTTEALLVHLADGAYQFCTEPDPLDWRDGAGVCLNFVKQGTTFQGYYGYPHSNSFVCLRGQLSEDWLQGEGLVLAWAGQTWPEIPQEEFIWDTEGRLYLSQGEIVHSEKSDEGWVCWILFRQARLNLEGLYRYATPRMVSPTQLCDWQFN